MSLHAVAWPRAASHLCPHGLWADQQTSNAYGKSAWPTARFLDSAERGCLSCKTLLRIIDEISPGWTAKQVNSPHLIQLEHDYGGLRISLIKSSLASQERLSWAPGRRTSLPELAMPGQDNQVRVQNVIFGPWLQAEEKAFARFSLMCLQTDEEAFPLSSETQTSAKWHLSNYDLGLHGNAPPILATRQWIHSTFDIVPCSSSPRAFERVKRCLKYCEENDEVCRGSHHEFVPHRLIKIASKPRLIGASRRGEQICASLHEPEEAVDYACLSYRWGEPAKDIVTTRRSNVDRFYKDINLETLPATVQDAITICHGIGLRYLWVDSLCIVQDNPSDWARESPQMLDIYAHSHVTIYATNTLSCKDQFLGPQRFADPRWQKSLATSIPKGLALPGSSLAARAIKDFAYLAPMVQVDEHKSRKTMWFSDLIDEPANVLSSRAWCLKEELLPNRRLYFNGYQMSWECGQRRVQETDYRGAELSHFRPSSSYTWKSLTGYSGRTFGEEQGLARVYDGYGRGGVEHFGDDLPFNMLREWCRIVVDYTTRQLTYSDDKLVAVAGLAQLIGRATLVQCDGKGGNDEYLAGLWRRTFIAELCWHPGPWEQMSQPTGYCAPTWSWASLNGPVCFMVWQEVESWKYPPTFVPVARFEKSHVELVSNASPFGRVKSAYVELVGPLVQVEVMITPHGRKKQMESKVRASNLRSYKVFLDVVATAPIISNTHKSYACWMRGSCSGDGCCKWNDESTGDSRIYFCLQLFTWECRSRRIESSTNNLGPVSFFLVLRRTPSGDYTRVGIGRALARKDIEWPLIGYGMQEGTRYQCPLFEAAKETCVRII